MLNYVLLFDLTKFLRFFFQISPFLNVRAGTLANIQTDEYVKTIISKWDDFRLNYLGPGETPAFPHLDGWIKHKLKNGLAPTTVESDMSRLNKALEFFFGWGIKVILDRDYFASIMNH